MGEPLLSRRTLACSLVSLGMALGVGVVPAMGQGGHGATRPELEATLEAAQSGAIKLSNSDRAAIQNRLTNGDFSIGDQVTVQVANEPTLQGTFTVEPGPALRLPDLPVISLHGVLRSELTTHLTKELSVYLRNPEVHATSLMRIAMFGAVGSPGFYHFSPNLTVSDAIMSAGGPTPGSDFGRSSIKRSGDKLFNGSGVKQAITDGTTLDRLNLHGGDVIEVGQRRSILAAGMRALLTAGAIAAAIIALRNL